jgi:hypothetical protein
MPGADADPLLRLTDVARTFDVSPPWLDRILEHKPRTLLKAVDGISLTIAKGETLGLVGESGCGKSNGCAADCRAPCAHSRHDRIRRRWCSRRPGPWPRLPIDNVKPAGACK